MTKDRNLSPAGRQTLDPGAVETWIFDLDNTLYNVSREMHLRIDQLLGAFVSQYLGVDRVEARRLQKSYFRDYGLTLRGLMVNHGLDPKVYLEFMLQADLTEIGPDPALAAAIGRLPGRKLIYTNAFAGHAERVLALLGMAEHFAAIHDIEAADYVPKPALDAYEDLCRRHEVDAATAVMIDDIAHNLEPAALLGMTTVWMRTTAEWANDVETPDYVDHVTDELTPWIEALLPAG